MRESAASPHEYDVAAFIERRTFIKHNIYLFWMEDPPASPLCEELALRKEGVSSLPLEELLTGLSQHALIAASCHGIRSYAIPLSAFNAATSERTLLCCAIGRSRSEFRTPRQAPQ